MAFENDETGGARGWNALRAGARRVAGAVAAHPLVAVLVAVLGVSVFFLAFPHVDTAVSALFYDAGEGFAARHNGFLRRLRELGPFLVRLIAYAAAAALLARMLLPSLRRLIDPRAPLFLLSTLALGPGLLVNAILKDHWGRARPRQVDLFGGEAPFSPVWQIVDHCDKNCSFVSGEASSAIWLFALVLLAPMAWRKPMAMVIGVLALALSLNRVAFGGHFLSDTILSWLLTGAVVLAIHHLFYVRPPAFLSRERLEAGLDGLGDRLRSLAAAGSRAVRAGLRRFARVLR